MKLINGRGQIGSKFSENIDKFKDINVTLYHTWNFVDKSPEVQQNCLKQFINYIEQNKEEKIIFTSTKSKEDNYYVKYKRLAERYLDLNKHLVIRLPNIIGKGICQRFRDEENIKHYGVLELLTLEDVYNKIVSIIKFSDMVGICNINGDKIDALLVKNLILFGKDVL
jgi:hypothetical protein